MAKHILIGGGTGFIGSNLTKLLTSKGYDVTTISRMPGLKRMTWHELESNGIPEKTYAVVNLAGQNVLDPSRRWSPGFRQNVWNSRINTTKNLVNAIEKATTKPKVFVSVSGVSLYEPGPTVYTEKDNGKDYDFMSRLCLKWEEAANLNAESDTKLVKVRCGVVLGRTGGMIKSLYLPFKLGLGGPVQPGDQPLPWIHITDICNLIKFCIEENQAKGVINGVAPQIVTNREFSKCFASALTRPALFPMPEFVVKLIFGMERGVLLTTGAKISSQKSIDLGFKFTYPTVDEACREVVNAKSK
ncbi:hypothetical protein HA402_008665 [Bradysia odoriphaga]|nr:hypothetical protein HA402_008665 [Bradysia odoriphaga]